MFRTEADLIDNPEQAAVLIAQLGEIYEHKLKNLDEAIAAYRGATLAPTHASALHVVRVNLPSAVGLGEPDRDPARCRRRTTPTPASARTRIHAASLGRSSSRSPSRASAAIVRCFACAPTTPPRSPQLERSAHLRDHVKELVVLLERLMVRGSASCGAAHSPASIDPSHGARPRDLLRGGARAGPAQSARAAPTIAFAPMTNPDVPHLRARIAEACADAPSAALSTASVDELPPGGAPH